MTLYVVRGEVCKPLSIKVKSADAQESQNIAHVRTSCVCVASDSYGNFTYML